MGSAEAAWSPICEGKKREGGRVLLEGTELWPWVLVGVGEVRWSGKTTSIKGREDIHTEAACQHDLFGECQRDKTRSVK